MGYFVNILPLYIQDSIYDKGYTWLDRFKLVQKKYLKHLNIRMHVIGI